MSTLVWDQTGERLYETGTRNAVLFPMTDGVYGNGVAWNGITAFTESPSGAEANDIYADDMKYLSLRSAEEYGATIEAYTYPDEWAQCDGSAEIAQGVFVGQQVRKPFGLSVRTVVGNDVDFENHGYKLHLVYNATASPSEKAYQTINDSPEAITFSWELSTIPIPIGANYKNAASITIDSTKADATKLKALEAILYGSESADSRLPLPAEVISIMGGGSDTGDTGETGDTGDTGSQG